MPSSLTSLAGAGIVTAFLFFQAGDQIDYATIPPEHQQVERMLSSQEVTLGEAIDIAMKDAGGGVAQQASFDLKNDGKMVGVTVFHDGKKTQYTIDANSGSIADRQDVLRFPGEPVGDKEMQETESGVKYYDFKEGDGESPPTDSAVVRVHYTGWLLNGMKFDSSRDRGEPVAFSLQGVIDGWSEGVESMKVGGKRKLIIPFELGYGERGNPRGNIPPRATLVFDVELLEIVADEPPQQQRRRGGRSR